MKKWFFLTAFVAGIFVCLFLTLLIVFVLATRGIGGLKPAVKILCSLVFLGWATREMFRSMKSGANSH